ncbi:MAG: hypothetical protein WCA04_01315 [Geobacteraceae bacterium]
MGKKGYIGLLLLVALLMPQQSWAVDIHGRSSTQFLTFINDFNNTRETDIGQYLLLNVTNIDKEGKFSVYGYGRGIQDLNNGNGIDGRLYYLYGEYRDLFDIADLRFGRQFINLSAGSAIIDGLQVNLKNIGPVGFTAVGGRDVIFGLNGETGYGGNMDFGLSAYLLGFNKTQLDVSWLRKWDHDDVSRDTIGGNFNQYLFNNMRLYANARYDINAEVFSEVLAGVKYFPMSNLIFTGEWYQSYPTFDATSIYSVFAVNRYQEYLFRADYTINQFVSVHGGYTKEDFGDNSTSDVVELGVSLRPIDKLAIHLSYDRTSGYSGDLNGGMLDVTYDASKDLRLSTGMTYDVFNRDDLLPINTNGTDFVSSPTETAQRYYVGGRYRLTKNMQATLRIDDLESDTRNSSDVSGRFVIDYDF